MKHINKLFSLLTLFTLSVVQASSQNNYVLVWQDDFCGPTLNEAVWNIEVNGNGGGNNELQYYRRENVTIETEPTSGKSCLVLTAKRETYSGKSFTSGRVNTKDKMIFKYGKIEARVKVPLTARGLWPAFWMMGNTPQSGGNVQWPACGEIDIFEMGQNVTDPQNTWGGHFHWGTSWDMYGPGAYPNTGSGTRRTNSTPNAGNVPLYPVQDTWTLWTMTWDENSIKMYLDLDKYPNREPYCTATISGTGVADMGTYFRKEFFILFNLAVGGDKGFPFNSSNNTPANVTALPTAGSTAKMYIDYIKVYQKGDVNQSYSGPVGQTADCNVPPISVASVTLNKTTTTLCIGSNETLTATVNPSNATNQNITWSSNNAAVTVNQSGQITAVSAGSATITVTTADGGKTATCTVTVNPLLLRTINASICEGGSYNFYGTHYSQAVSGVERRFTNTGRCDSVVTLNLTVSPLLRRTINASICEGGSYNFYGTHYTQAVSGVERRFANTGRCDSVVTLNLTVLPTFAIERYITIFDNEPYNGQFYAADDYVFIDTLTAANSCDSIVTTYLHVEENTGLDLIIADNISIYPNPVKDVLYIDIPFFEKMEYLKSVEITDIAGRAVRAMHALPLQGTATINISALPQGVYLVKIYTDKGVVIKRVIKM